MRLSSIKKLGIWVSSLAMTLSLSSCMAPSFNQEKKNAVEVLPHPTGAPLQGEDLLKALTRQTSDGLWVKDIDFSFVVPVKTIEKENDNGNTVSKMVNQRISVSGGEIEFRIDANENNKVYFSANLPVTYNETSFVTFTSTYADNVLYLGIEDTDTDVDSYSFKYKIEIVPGSSNDEFSELIDTLFEMVDKYGSLLNLGFVSGAAKSVIDSDASSAIKNAKKALSIVEGESKGDGTFTYDISFKMGESTIPLKLNCESDGTLLSASIASENGDLATIKGSRTMQLGFNSLIQSDAGYISIAPSDKEHYQSLVNVEKFLSRLYPLVNEPSFTGEGSFSFEHVIARDDEGNISKKENATLDVSLKADVSNLINNSREISSLTDSLPNAISLGLDFNVDVEEDDGSSKTTKRALAVDMAREKDSSGSYSDLGYAYLTTDAIATKMDFFTLDSMIGKVIDLADLGSSSSLRALLSESAVNDIKGIMNKFEIGKTVNSLLDAYLALTGDSSALKGIENGEYERLLKVIKTMKNATHSVTLDDGSISDISTLDIVLDLSKIGLSGEMAVSLYDGSIRKLAGISFSSVTLGDISFSGELYFMDAKGIEVKVTETSLERTYFRRLPDIFDGLQSFVDNKQTTFSVYGSVMNFAGDDGFTIQKGNGNISLDLENKNGTGEIIFKDRKSASKEQDYRLGIDVKEVYENGHMVSNQSDMYFMVNTPGSGVKPLVGYFSIDSLNGIISLVKAFSKTEDEQFTKYIEWFQTAETSSLLAKVVNGNEINPLLASGCIKSLSNNESSKVVTLVINGDFLSLSDDLYVTIGYKGDYFTLDGMSENANRSKGGISYLSVKMKTDSKNIDLTFELKDYVAPGEKVGNDYNWNAYSYQNLFTGGSNGVHSKSNYTDWSSIQILLQYVLNSALLGRGESYQYGSDGVTASLVNSGTKRDYSTYHVGGSITIGASLFTASFEVESVELKIDLYVYVKGATVKVYGVLDTPHIKVGFEANDARYVSYFAYETDENNPKGTLYIERLKDNNISKTSMHKVTGEDFLENAGDWIVGYMMGLFTGNVPKTGYDMFHTDSSSDSSTIYVENVFTGSEFKYETQNGNPVWKNIQLNIGGFNIKNLSGTISATLYGNSNAATLSGLSISGGIEYSVISVNIKSSNFVLSNASSSGVYSECWGSSSESSNYSSISNGSTGFMTVKNRVNASGERSRLPGASFAGTFSGKNSSGKNITLTISRNGSATLKKNGSDYYPYHTSTTLKWENWETKTLCVYVTGNSSWISIFGDTYSATYTFQLQSNGTYKETNNQDGIYLYYSML